MASAPLLAVARIKKPHGLKGDVYAWVLTDRPEDVLVEGRELMRLDAMGRARGVRVVIERSRPYHRQWLLKFRGLDDRTAVEALGQELLGVPAEELEPPAADELYVHELPGADVVVNGVVVGRVTELVDVPGGNLLAVDVGGREVLVPFRRPIVQRIDRAARRIEVEAPEGLLDL